MAMKYALYNPATHVAVPKEPTREMVKDLVNTITMPWTDDVFSPGTDLDQAVGAIAYTAVLAAAPPHVVDDESARLRSATAGMMAEIAAWKEANPDWVADNGVSFEDFRDRVKLVARIQKLEAERKAAFLAGARAMQEAAAKIASARLSDGKTEFNMGQNASAYGIASEIWRIDHEKVVG